MVSIDMFYLLVENVFGSIFLSGLGIAAFILFVGMLSNMSPTLITWLLIFFIGTFAIGYVGGVAAALMGIAALVYFFWGVLNLINAAQG